MCSDSPLLISKQCDNHLEMYSSFHGHKDAPGWLCIKNTHYYTHRDTPRWIYDKNIRLYPVPTAFLFRNPTRKLVWHRFDTFQALLGAVFDIMSLHFG